MATGFSISNKGILTFAPGQTFPGAGGGGSVTSVGLSAPASDFTVSGSPVTGIGTLGFQWTIQPGSASVPNAIVKRDAAGSFTASAVNAHQINADSHTPGGAGIFGTTDNGGFGVLGVVTSLGTATGTAVYGENFGSSSAATGFLGDGVVGISHSQFGSGVEGINRSGGDGVVGQATNGGFAGHFNGDVFITGTLDKSGGAFKIDHPLDPANKYLLHSFVESPDMKNIYDGTVVTDGRGGAVVQMPEWFDALNRDFRYQLTVIGQFAQAIVAAEMVNRTFSIQTDKPNVKVSWQVTGIRQDAWANANRIPVEQAKPENERGLYLYPELFDAPPAKSIFTNRHPGAVKP